MDDLIDLSNEEPSKYLDRAEWKGWIRSKRVLQAPPASYLLGTEQPAFVLVNDAGIELTFDGVVEHHTPAAGYRALALVTDTRLLFLIGDAAEDGDEVIPVPFSDVESVSVSDASPTELVVATPSERFVYPCRAALGGVAEFVQSGVDDFEEVAYLLSQVEVGIDDAQTELGQNWPDLEETADAIAFGVDHLERAERAASEAGPGPKATFQRRFDHYREVLQSLRADLTRERAEAYRRRARRARLGDEYETALKHLKTARRRYGTLGEDAVESFTATSDAIATLRREPLARAERAHALAKATPDATRAVAHWEAVLERYRTVLSLDWGHDATRFEFDRETVRKRLASVFDRLLFTRTVAADRWLEEGDCQVGLGRHERAAAAYDRARGSLARAAALARQHDPARVEPLADLRSTVEARLDRLDVGDVDHRGTSLGVSMGPPTDEKPDTLDMDGDELSQFVADVWATRGWKTAAFRTAAARNADVVATRDGPFDREASLWVHHETERDREDVLAAIDEAEDEPDADYALVTTDCVDDRLLRTAAGHPLLVVDRRRLRALERFVDSDVRP